MLEKELAKATKMAEAATKKVEQLRKKLLSESEKTQARITRELKAARKRRATTHKKLNSAKAALRKKATPDNHKKVETLMQQAQEFAESLPGMAKAAFEAAEKYVAVKTDAVLADRKSKAVNQAVSKVERAAAKPKRKSVKKKAAATKRAAPKKKAAARKKTAPRKKTAAKRKAAPGRKAPARRRAA
jgi:colicin import membrane protein